MNRISLFACLIISVNAMGQWNCFPANQYSYYQFNDQNKIAYDLIVQDSTRISGGQTIQYFKRLIQDSLAPECRSSIFNFYQMNNPDFLDSIIISNDTVYFNEVSDWNYFLPQSPVGHTWMTITSDTTFYSCDSIIGTLTFGQPDSVKYFHASGPTTDIISISKQFGFIDFPFIKNYHLSGIKNNSAQYGFSPPAFLDFLPYHAGDILLWEWTHQFFGPPPPYNSMVRDSITQVIISNDSLTYYYDRLQINSFGTVYLTTGLIQTYTLSDIGNALISPPNDVSVLRSFGSTLFLTSYLFSDYDSIQNNNWIEREFYWAGADIDSACTVIPIIDGVYVYYYFNTHQGMTRKVGVGQSMTSNEILIGARINNVVYGNTDLNVGINSIKNSFIKIFPIPFSDLLIINTGEEQFKSYEIIDLTGRKIHEGELINGENHLQIPEIAKGIYFIKLIGKNIYQQRIVKE